MRYILLLTLALTACGKKGDLEIQDKPVLQQGQTEQTPPPGRPPATKPLRQSFPLDFLL